MARSSAGRRCTAAGPPACECSPVKEETRVNKRHGSLLYLCATRRRRAEGESGGAKVLRRRRGGSNPGEARSAGNGLLGVLLVVRYGGGNTRPSCKAVEWVRIVGTAQTAQNADGKLTVAVRPSPNGVAALR